MIGSGYQDATVDGGRCRSYALLGNGRPTERGDERAVARLRIELQRHTIVRSRSGTPRPIRGCCQR